MTKKILESLEPQLVWSIFEEITKVPRPSKKEEKIRDWVKKWAKNNDVEIKNEDKVGNILLAKEATKGCENYPTLVIQAHLDMVCQKVSNVEIDFENDPIPVVIKGDVVIAEGTTLGADNGIGIAYGLAALISEDLKHGPLEVLLTVDEETGLTGAFAIKTGFFSAKYLLNVDSESLGKITISSAGGGGSDIVLSVKLTDKTDYQSMKLSISGLMGGHSGTDIDLPRLNAIKIGVDALLGIKDSILIHTIKAGSAHNAIPRDFECEFLVTKKQVKEISQRLKQWKKTTLEIAKASEPNIKIDIINTKATQAITSEKTISLLDLLDDLKHGPLTYSKDIVGLVQTSSNLAQIDSEKGRINIHVSTRSSANNELDPVRNEIKEMGEKFGAKVTLDEAYPGWEPNPSSRFVQMVKKSYEEIVKEPVELEAIHAGLECGLFLAIEPDLQVTSIGPNIGNAHSPDEYIEIESAAIVWDVVKKIIENMGTL
ncbi:MAG: beta-Ala-His dipeptidase [Candidatus Heimdallarchaeota archaeon]